MILRDRIRFYSSLTIMPERNLRFQQKLWQIVNSCDTGAVSWSQFGDSIIFKFSQFKKEYLDRNVNFCKSNKIASFVRQLNLYGFRKLVKTHAARKKFQDEHEFQNVYFQRGRKDLLEHVVRSSTTPPYAKKPRGGFYNSVLKKRGRRGRGRGRRVKLVKVVCVADEADHCYGKLVENRSPQKPEDNKENEFYSSGKYPISNLWNYDKNMRKEKKIVPPADTKRKPLSTITQQVVTHKRFNVYELPCNVFQKSIQKPFDYNSMKKEFDNSQMILSNHCDEDRQESHKMATEMDASRKSDANFSNIDDDFIPVSAELNEDELCKNVVNYSFESYLTEPVVFNDDMISSENILRHSVEFCSCNDCENSEEQQQLEEAYARMNGKEGKLTYCVCNTNIAPIWMLPVFLR